VGVNEEVSGTPHARSINKMKNPTKKCDILCGGLKKLVMTGLRKLMPL
jgi:hypothetical protein